MTNSSYTFEQGAAIQVGSHGVTDYVYESGVPVPNTGESTLVFESGTGLGAPLTDILENFDSTWDPGRYRGQTGAFSRQTSFVTEGSNGGRMDGDDPWVATNDTRMAEGNVYRVDAEVPTTGGVAQVLAFVQDQPGGGNGNPPDCYQISLEDQDSEWEVNRYENGSSVATDQNSFNVSVGTRYEFEIRLPVGGGIECDLITGGSVVSTVSLTEAQSTLRSGGHGFMTGGLADVGFYDNYRRIGSL